MAPTTNDWTGEAALDLDMVSAACPSCNILLIEADDDQGSGLYIANNAAAQLGATVISNSWGENQDDPSGPQLDAQYFSHPGASIFFASGDSAYGAQYPATSEYVTAVGGTELRLDSANPRGWSESVWYGVDHGKPYGASSGCSQSVAQPPFQAKINTGCSGRAESDLSAVAANLAVYDNDNGNGGWIRVDGTSAATPLVAAIFALTGHAGADNSFSYANAGAFNDVTSGKNGTCSAPQLCTAGPGWDGPTGNGTPNGDAMLAISTAG
jgi:subtilase family serine protease